MDLKKIYIEPTTKCNLSCKTCIRNTWTHEFGDMDFEVFKSFVMGLDDSHTVETMTFAGFGEPFYHKDIFKMIKLAKSKGINVEIITNGTLLDDEMCENIIDSKLDKLWVSIDGVSEKSYEDIRVGANQNKVIENMLRLKKYRDKYKYNMGVGISFVIMKDNAAELPGLIPLARKIAARDIKVTNVFPYTKDMVDNVVYDRTLLLGGCDAIDFKFNIDLPVIDVNEYTKEALYRLLRSGNSISIMGDKILRKIEYCKFIKEGCTVVGWDGRVSPCLALLYENKTFLHGYERDIKPVSYGNIKEKSIKEIWEDDKYKKFRHKVDEFDFPGCTYCGGCNSLESNEEDCFGNEFPVCGGCLWAQGFIQCP